MCVLSAHIFPSVIRDIFIDIEFLTVSLREAETHTSRLEARRQELLTSFRERLTYLANLEGSSFVDRHILSTEGAYAAFQAAFIAKEEADKVEAVKVPEAAPGDGGEETDAVVAVAGPSTLPASGDPSGSVLPPA